MKKVAGIITAIIIAGLIATHGFALVRIQTLTSRHGYEFAETYRQIEMLESVESLSVLELSEHRARIYHSGVAIIHGEERFVAFISDFEMIDEQWETVWRDQVRGRTGSADHFMWRHWWLYDDSVGAVVAGGILVAFLLISMWVIVVIVDRKRKNL